MNKALQFLLIFSVIMCGISLDAQAQRKKKKKKDVDEYFDDKGNFTQRLWYGADISIQFPRTGFSVNSDSYTGNLIFIGISPMAGFKVTDYFSVGPRIEFNYQTARFEKFPSGSSLPNELKSKATNVGVGVFGRLKILQTYFIHLEYQRLGESIATGVDFDTNELINERVWDDHYYAGAGYSSSFGAIGFQASLLWDFSQEFSANNIPIVYRAGLNYKF